MAGHEDVEETCRKARETVAASERLLAEARDPGRDVGKLMADWSTQVARATDVLKTRGAPSGTAMACLLATVEVLGDMNAVEIAASEGLELLGGDKPEPAPHGGVRRGMRV